MNDEAIQLIAANLGVATELVWGALLRQAIISGVADCIWIFVVLPAIILVVVRFSPRIVKWILDDGCYGDRFTAWFGLVPVWILCIALVLVTLSQLPVTFAAFFNQEYWAIQKALSLVRGK